MVIQYVFDTLTQFPTIHRRYEVDIRWRCTRLCQTLAYDLL